MDRTAATAHSGHDELLIARLFGGDVTELERARALDLMSECSDCAALFADLGAIEEAGVEMAIPARPREFTLTPQDAARLRPRRRVPVSAGWVGLRRAFGSSMAALGLIGIVATGYLSGPGAGGGSTVQRDAAQPAAVAAAPSMAPANPANAYTNGSASGAPSTWGPVALSSGYDVNDSSEKPSPRPAASAAAGSPGGELAAASPAVKSASSTQPGPAATAQSITCCGQPSNGTATSGYSDGSGATPPAAPSSGGPDAALMRLAGFGGLFLAGLAVLIVPRLRRFRTPRRASKS